MSACDGCSDPYCGDCAAREALAAQVELRRVSGLPAVRVHHPHVEQSTNVLAGSPIVRGTKVPVRRLWAWHRKGVTAETLVKRYPALGPAKVLDALSFAYDNQELLEADLERERQLLEQQDIDPIPGDMKQMPLPVEKK